MRGVMFNDKHSYWDWNLMLKEAPKVSTPEPKTHYVDIPGKNGDLDLTEAHTGKGNVRYHDREIKLEFVILAGRRDWPDVANEILETLHGREVQISLDDDPDFYYTGRVTVGEAKQEAKTVVLPMTAKVRPFKVSKEGVKKL